MGDAQKAYDFIFRIAGIPASCLTIDIDCYIFFILILRLSRGADVDEVFMDKKFVGKMKMELLSMKEKILNNLIAENEDFQALVKDMDPKDLADIAADDIDRKTLEVLSAHDINRLRMIENAISRINNDRYGICISCNKRIPTERLEAIPYAFMCIDCQTSDERRNR